MLGFAPLASSPLADDGGVRAYELSVDVGLLTLVGKDVSLLKATHLPLIVVHSA